MICLCRQQHRSFTCTPCLIFRLRGVPLGAGTRRLCRSTTTQPRTHSIIFVGQVDSRPGYADRLALFTSAGDIPGAPVLVGTRNPRTRHTAARGVRLCNISSSSDHDRCLLQSRRLGRHAVQRLTEASNFSLCLRGGTALIMVVRNSTDLDWAAYHSRAADNLLNEALAVPCNASIN